MAPNHPRLYGTLDRALEYRRRFAAEEIRSLLVASGFRVEKIFDFNRIAVPGWWMNGKVLGRKRFSRLQLKAMDMAMPILRRLDRIWPWRGLTIGAIAIKDAAANRERDQPRQPTVKDGGSR